MTRITRRNDEAKKACIIYYTNREIKRFSFYDDWAYTKASDYEARMRQMTLDEFKEIHPEFFL